MSIAHAEITTTVSRYLDSYPDEAASLQPLLHSMETSADITSRKEFTGGHVTCGAVVIDQDRQLLLIRHKALDTWLLPGGHVEPDDEGLTFAALRELEEEAGVSWREVISTPGHDLAPIDIDLHAIPANPAKGEPDHWHADFRFAFRVKEPVVQLQLEEVDGFDWRPLSDAPTGKLANKLTRL
jgi:8-oxo-dGTP pyrophosphatase MutT (NUDIX family)